MRSVTIPVWQALASLPPVLALEGAVQADSRVALVALWSWVAEHGAGPHGATTVERAVGWTGSPGALASALVTTGWAVEGDNGLVTVRPWADVVGAADVESPVERRRRLTRERVRKHRECERYGVTRRNAPVTLGNAPVTLGNADVTLDSVTGNADVTLCNASAATVPTPSLFSGSQKKKKKEEEEEKNYVVSIPAPVAPAGLTAGGVPVVGHAGGATLAERLAVDPGADLSDRFDVEPATADERPAVAPGSTINPEARSVPVPAPDRAPEADSNRPRAKRSKAKRATVDLERVDPSVRAVWAAYASTLGTRVVLSAARVDLIAARLADGWTVDDLSTACRGYGASPFHNGDNDRGQRYQAIELWLRDAAHVEQGLALARSPPAPKKRGPEPLVGVNDYWEDLMRRRAAEEAGANGAKK